MIDLSITYMQLFASYDVIRWTDIFSDNIADSDICISQYEFELENVMAPIHCRGSIGDQVKHCNISPNLFWWMPKGKYIFRKCSFLGELFL